MRCSDVSPSTSIRRPIEPVVELRERVERLAWHGKGEPLSDGPVVGRLEHALAVRENRDRLVGVPDVELGGAVRGNVGIGRGELGPGWRADRPLIDAHAGGRPVALDGHAELVRANAQHHGRGIGLARRLQPEAHAQVGHGVARRKPGSHAAAAQALVAALVDVVVGRSVADLPGGRVPPERALALALVAERAAVDAPALGRGDPGARVALVGHAGHVVHRLPHGPLHALGLAGDLPALLVPGRRAAGLGAGRVADEHVAVHQRDLLAGPADQPLDHAFVGLGGRAEDDHVKPIGHG
jgi:hypothetical protein